MATYFVNSTNWNSPAFWAAIVETSGGHTLDFSQLSSDYVVVFDADQGRITITFGGSSFVIGEDGARGVNATLGAGTDLGFFDAVIGSGGDDVMTGDLGSDTMAGGSGHDTIHGGGADDTIDGGDGNDTLYGGDGADILDGTTGNDLIFGDNDDDLILGGAGNDTLYGGAGNDSILGGTEQDLIFGGDGSDDLAGGDAADTIFGDAGHDLMSGDAGNDLLFGGDGDDTIFGVTGADTVSAGAGNDSVAGGSGEDLLFGAGGADSILGGSENDTIDGGAGNDTLLGNNDNDQIFGGAQNDLIFGGSGDDTLFGGAETEVISYEDFSQTPQGWTNALTGEPVTTTSTLNDGNVFLGNFVGNTTGDEQIRKTFHLGEQADSAVLQFDFVKLDSWDSNSGGEFGVDERVIVYIDGVAVFSFTPNGGELSFGETFDGVGTFAGGSWFVTSSGADSDMFGAPGEFGDRIYSFHIDLDNPNDSVTLGFGTTLNQGLNDESWGIDNVWVEATFPAGDDIISGGDGNDWLFGGDGNDTLSGDAGADTFEGNAGADIILGGADADTFYAGSGDTVVGGESVTTGTDNDTLVLNYADVESITYGGGNNEAGTVTFTAASGGGTLTFSEIENITFAGPVDGTAAAELMGAGYTDLNGDQVDGTDGVNDTILGNGGNDTINAGSGDDLVYGGTGNDVIRAQSGNDTLYGDAGNDDLQSGTGNDVIYGGDGAELIHVFANSGADTVFGGEGNDAGVGDILNMDVGSVDTVVTFTGNEAGNVVAGSTTVTFSEIETIWTDAGNDTIDASVATSTINIWSGDGNDLVIGGSGNDSFAAGAGVDEVLAGAGNDTIYGEDGADQLYGGDGDDLLYGGSDNDYLQGGAGRDVLGGGFGDDTSYGGAGNDVIFDGAGNNLLDGGEGNDRVTSGLDNDTIFGGLGDDQLSGEAGNDSIFGDAGNDTLTGGVGVDYLSGGDDADRFYAGSGDTVVGGEGGTDNDTLVLNYADVESITYGGGNNEAGVVTFTAASGGGTLTFSEIENINFAGPVDGTAGDDTMLFLDYTDAQGDEIDGTDGINDTIFGYGGNDTITAGNGADLVFGGTGNDQLFGNFGNDTIHGDAGDDFIFGDLGNDTVYGGAGNDGINTSEGNDLLFGGDDADRFTVQIGHGVDTVFGGEGGLDDDTLVMFSYNEAATVTYTGNEAGTLEVLGTTVTFSDIEALELTANNDSVNAAADGAGVAVEGFAGNDTIIGGTGADTVYGGLGDDSVLAGAGDDILFGGDGHDWLDAGDGNDTIFGGDGDDRLIGDLGDDVLFGGAGHDSITGGIGDDTAMGGAGQDTLEGGVGNDVLFGGGDGDRLIGGEGNDTLRGDAQERIKIYSEDFSTTPTGWIDPATGAAVTRTSVIDNAGQGNSFLGNFAGNGSGAAQISKTFQLSGDPVPTLIEFDFVKIDSWDDVFGNHADSFIVYINGVQAFEFLPDGFGDGMGNGADAAGTFAGGSWSVTSSGQDEEFFGDPGYTDRIYQVTITLNEPGDTVTLGIGSTTFQELQDESWGIDNLSISVLESVGNAGADSLFGGGGDDLILGEGGNDDIEGAGGNDQIYGGIGQDTILGGAGADTIHGDDGDDLIHADGVVFVTPAADATNTSNDDLFRVANNSDLTLRLYWVDTNGTLTDAGTVAPGALASLTTVAGQNLALYDAATDTPLEFLGPISFGTTITYNDANDVVYGGDGADTIFGGFGQDQLFGGAGDDVLAGDAGNDELFGDAGNDTIIVQEGQGNDTVFGGEDPSGDDVDTLNLDGDASAQGVILALTGDEEGTFTFNGSGETGSFFQIESFDLTAGDDLADASASTVGVMISGGDGNDTLIGGSGNDQLFGGDMVDTFILRDGFGQDTVDGGFSYDVLDLSQLSYPVEVVFTAPGAGIITAPSTGESITFLNIEALILTNGDDTVNAALDDGYTYIQTRDGDDLISGSAGNDVYDDEIYAPNGQGNDTFFGGDGDDSLWVGTDNDLAFGGAGSDSIEGQEGDDTLFGDSGYDTLHGMSGNDVISGDAGNDALFGGADRDLFLLQDGFGSDVIFGGESGNDFDVIDGGAMDQGLTVTLSDAEAGTILAGADTVDFTGIEGLSLSDQNDSLDGTTATGSIIVAGAGGDDTLTGGSGSDLMLGDGSYANLIQNGSFEQTAGMTVTSWGYRGDDATAPGGWYTGTGGVIDIHHTGAGEATDGSNWLDAEGSPGIDTISQAVQGVISGQTYTLQFDAIDAIGDNSVNVYWGGDLIATIAPGSVDPERFSFVVTGGAGDGSNILTFENVGPIDMSGVAIDNVRLMGFSNLDWASGADLLNGGAGDDTLIGGAGNDTLIGGSGNDTLDGGADDDSLIGGAGSDLAYGGDGNDFINTRMTFGQGSPDRGYQGAFPDDSDPNNDRDTVFGGAGNDTVLAGDDNDLIFGGDGADSIDAGFDDDTVHGDGGNDTIIGGEGRDLVYGGDGDDLIYGDAFAGHPEYFELTDADGSDLRPDNSQDTLFGGAGNDVIYGGDDADLLYGDDGDDQLFGGVDDDTLHGDAGNDTLFGDQGDDALFGGDGADQLDGGAGADTLVGDAGDDTITVGSGDTATGGRGNDSFNVTPAMLTGAALFIDGGEDDETVGDTLNITGPANIVYDSGNPENGTVTWLDGTTLTFQNIETVNYVPCFTEATLIKTRRGEVPAAQLRIGDMVLTRNHGYQPIRWIGTRRLERGQLAANPALNPVVIRAGALGVNAPERDLTVSPQHRMLIGGGRAQLWFGEDEVFVAALHLTCLDGVEQTSPDAVTYVHIMFDCHQIISGDGAWSESYQPGDLTLADMDHDQRAELFAIFPELFDGRAGKVYPAARVTLSRHEVPLLFA